jgi:hypothetical protein
MRIDGKLGSPYIHLHGMYVQNEINGFGIETDASAGSDARDWQIKRTCPIRPIPPHAPSPAHNFNIITCKL